MSNRKRIRRPPRYAADVAQAPRGYPAQLKPRTVGIVQVKHDGWCRIWQGKACNCEPIVEPPEFLVDEVV
jgi:hypothetical protein